MSAPPATALHRPTLVIGLGLFVLAAITFHDAYTMKVRPGYGMGADAVTYLIAGVLGLLGLGHLIAAFRPQETAAPADWRAVTWVAAGLAALVLSIWFGGGFILGASLLFAMTARAFGRKAFVQDLLIGFVIAFGIFLLFNKLLTLALPMGPFERLF